MYELSPLPVLPWGSWQGNRQNVEFKFLYDEVPRPPPVLPWGSWQEMAGAGSQGTEPRSMIWDGTLTDSYKEDQNMISSIMQCDNGI